MSNQRRGFKDLILAALISGAVISALLGFFFHRTSTQISEEIKQYFDKEFTFFKTTITWREKALS